MVDSADTKPPSPHKDLPKVARDALAEAKTRKAQIDAVNSANKDEQGGRGGLDPSRYGDWEVKGITSDF